MFWTWLYEEEVKRYASRPMNAPLVSVQIRATRISDLHSIFAFDFRVTLQRTVVRTLRIRLVGFLGISLGKVILWTLISLQSFGFLLWWTVFTLQTCPSQVYLLVILGFNPT